MLQVSILTHFSYYGKIKGKRTRFLLITVQTTRHSQFSSLCLSISECVTVLKVMEIIKSVIDSRSEKEAVIISWLEQ